MKFDLQIETYNAAFDDTPQIEVARILREVADRIERGEDASYYRNVLDINGNIAARFKLA